jgi:hypothetical protein
MATLVRLEQDDQRHVFLWAKAQEMSGNRNLRKLALLFAIPNSSGKRSYKLSNFLSSQGLKSGIPDLFLPVAMGGFFGLFLELKRKVDPARVSEEQKKWIAALNAENYLALVVYGEKEACETLQNYLNGYYKIENHEKYVKKS